MFMRTISSQVGFVKSKITLCDLRSPDVSVRSITLTAHAMFMASRVQLWKVVSVEKSGKRRTRFLHSRASKKDIILFISQSPSLEKCLDWMAGHV